jgi:hypothetical protein
VSTLDDPFVRALSLLASAKVDFVVVGVGGINFFARDASEAVATRDLDVLVRPTPETLGTALRALDHAGFSFEAGGEPFLDIADAVVLAQIVRAGATVTVRSDDGAEIDLMMSMSGFDFAGLAEDAVSFRIAGSEVKVGRLEKLLRSKELSGRPKDVAFLALFKARNQEA